MLPVKLPLSVAIITYNEERRLPACLASVAFAAEVVVVDSESTDRTVAIAEQSGAKVQRQPWRGFGLQKQSAIDLCTQPYILVLDADERVAPPTAIELATLIQSGLIHDAYSLPRKNYFLGRWIKHAGWWPDRVVRLFQKGRATMSANLVHESLRVSGSTGELQNPLLHYATRDLEQTMNKMNSYSTSGAEDLWREGKQASVAKALARGAWAFFYNYGIRLGFLDGAEGLIIAVSDASNKFFKYAKLYALNKKGEDDA